MGTKGEPIRLLFAAAAMFNGDRALALDEPSSSTSIEPSDEPAGSHDVRRDIVVFGQRDDGSIAGVAARDELDEDDIEAFGLDDVGEIIEELTGNIGRSGEAPLILINGELGSGISDVSDLPPEALKRIQLLPPDAGVRFGSTRVRPVINVVVKRRFRQVTALAQASEATAGGARRVGGEIKWTAVRGPDRTNIALKADGADPLFEAERGIVSEPDPLPLSFSGIVLPQPLFGQQIDPALSALAGRLVAFADVPRGTASPVLADFLATAGQVTPGDLGNFRSLLPRTRRSSINATFARRLSKSVTAQFYLRADYARSQSYNGATEAFLMLPASAPASPFTTDVTVARYIGPPLEQGQGAGNIDVGGTLNGRIGGWQATLGVSWLHGQTRTRTERGLDTSALQIAIASGLANPFAALEDRLLTTMLVDPASRRRDRGLTQFNLTGPLFALPAGPIIANFNVTGSRERSFTRSAVRGVVSERRTARDEVLARGGLQVPLFTSRTDGGGAFGDLSLSLSGSARKISGARTYTGHGYGFDWRLSNAISFDGGYDSVQIPPTQITLIDPVTVRDNVRVFDFIRNETVGVRYLTGGNPDIPTERRATWSFGTRINLLSQGRIEFAANWTRQTSRDVQSALPPPSAEVQAAFADRYLRDDSGRLTQVDARAVSFARSDRDEFTWGFSLRRHFGGQRTETGADDFADMADDSVSSSATRSSFRKGLGGVRVNASVQHVWTLSSSRQARAGLPVIDLLAGGAAGYGGGQPRHRVEFRGAASAGGVGVQVSGAWSGASEIRAGSARLPSDLHFSTLTRVDLRAYADLGRVFGSAPMLKGARLAVEVENVLNRQTMVRDRSGAVPLSYQRYLLDPVGRSISVSLRKKF